MQAPAMHMSPCVHLSPSLQGEPFVFAGLVQAPVDGRHVPALWHWSRAVQTTVLLPEQKPAWHVSVRVHALPSLQVEPSVFAGLEQPPVATEHVPATWQVSRAVQTTGAPPMQLPDWQVSVRVHGLPSVHDVPLVACGLVQTPVWTLHVPTRWH